MHTKISYVAYAVYAVVGDPRLLRPMKLASMIAVRLPVAEGIQK